jgi:hypothetical protein
MAEKSDHVAHTSAVGHLESREDKHYTPNKLDILGVDVENRDAVKGDESDGKIDWTWMQIAATVSLAGLYVGAYSSFQWRLISMLTSFKVLKSHYISSEVACRSSQRTSAAQGSQDGYLFHTHWQ